MPGHQPLVGSSSFASLSLPLAQTRVSRSFTWDQSQDHMETKGFGVMETKLRPGQLQRLRSLEG